MSNEPRATTPDPLAALPTAAILASALMAANIPCDSGEDVDRLVAEMWTRGLRIVTADHRDGLSDEVMREGRLLHTWAGHIDCNPKNCTVARLARLATPTEEPTDE